MMTMRRSRWLEQGRKFSRKGATARRSRSQSRRLGVKNGFTADAGGRRCDEITGLGWLLPSRRREFSRHPWPRWWAISAPDREFSGKRSQSTGGFSRGRKRGRQMPPLSFAISACPSRGQYMPESSYHLPSHVNMTQRMMRCDAFLGVCPSFFAITADARGRNRRGLTIWHQAAFLHPAFALNGKRKSGQKGNLPATAGGFYRGRFNLFAAVSNAGSRSVFRPFHPRAGTPAI